MKEEIAKVLTMVNEGKLDVEKAAELIAALKDSGVPAASPRKPHTYLDKTLKIRIVSQDGDNVNVNLPLKLVKAVLKTGHSIASRLPESEKYVKDLDIDLLLDAIEHEADGQIVDVTSANNDKVLVVIE